MRILFLLNQTKRSILIPARYYTFEALAKLTNDDISMDKTTGEVTVNGSVANSLRTLINKEYASPLFYEVYLKGINIDKNYYNGKKSELLSIIPIHNTKFGDTITYQPEGQFKDMYGGMINQLEIQIKDEDGKDYGGKFLVELILQE